MWILVTVSGAKIWVPGNLKLNSLIRPKLSLSTNLDGITGEQTHKWLKIVIDSLQCQLVRESKEIIK